MTDKQKSPTQRIADIIASIALIMSDTKAKSPPQFITEIIVGFTCLLISAGLAAAVLVLANRVFTAICQAST